MRTLRMNRLLPLFLSFPLLSLLGSCASAPTAAPALKTTTVVVDPPDEPLPIPLVELRGSATEMGEQHGRELSDRIRFLHTNYLDVFLARIGTGTRMLAYGGATMFEQKLSPEHRAEVQGLAAGAGLDERSIMLGQCFLDLTSMVACSTVSLPAEASADGVARMGRNLDFPSLNVLDSRSAVLVFKPSDGRYAFASITWPGLLGVLSGMNEHGLVLCNMEVTRGPRMPVAMPYTMLYRTVLEKCRDVDEAVALLQRTPRQTPNNIMLMDAAGNRAACELTPEGVVVRRGTPGKALISTNHQRGQDCDTPGRCDRYDALHDQSAAEFGKIDVKQIESMLAAAAQPRFTVQSMVFEPSNRVIYLATGKEAAKQKFYRVDLKPHFRD